jgi:uncharacterized protein (TIGR00290 family)
MPRKKLLLSWSSGKDSAWALHRLRQQNQYEIVGLLTTVNQAFNRVAMHGTRVELLRAQAASAGLPLIELPLPWPCSNDIYESIMQSACSEAISAGVEVIAFGDLYLQEIRDYREKQLQGTGLTPIFPLWEIPTDKLAQEMISGGLRARITCIDPKCLPHSFAGRDFDTTLLHDLPSSADPCGENGEFHTCVYAGPIFSKPIDITTGEIVERDGFVYADMLISNSASQSPILK